MKPLTLLQYDKNIRFFPLPFPSIPANFQVSSTSWFLYTNTDIFYETFKNKNGMEKNEVLHYLSLCKCVTQELEFMLKRLQW